MALFNFKKKKSNETEVSAPKAVKKAKVGASATACESHAEVLLRPHVTEKATLSAEGGAYVFVVAPSATKASIRAHVKRLYDVVPTRVNIANLPSKRTLARGRRGRKPGMKKAYVYLPKGKTIELA